MKVAAAIALAVCCLGAALPACAAEAPLAAPVEACIRGNAIKVSAAIPDLNQAVDFLVGKLCAKPIADQAAAMQRAATQEYVDGQRKQCEDWKKAHPGAKPTGDVTEDTSSCAMMDAVAAFPANIGYSIVYAHGEQPMPEATSLAARLLLDLRLAHENPPGR